MESEEEFHSLFTQPFYIQYVIST
jgi:hypothetical protein